MIVLILLLYLHILYLLKRRLSAKADKGTTVKSSLPITIDSLPNELLIKIFLPLDPIDLINMEGVNTRWQQVSKSLWENVQEVEMYSFEVDDVSFASHTSEMGKRRVKIRTIQYGIIRSILSRCGAHVQCLQLCSDDPFSPGDKPLNCYIMAMITELCTNLIHMNISYINYIDTGALASFLRSNSNIKRLTLEDFTVDRYFQYLPRLKFLEELDIFCSDSQEYVPIHPTLRHAESLRKLDLSHASMETLRIICSISKLENLKIHELLIEDDLLDISLLIEPLWNMKALTVPRGMPQDIIQTLCLHCPNLEYFTSYGQISEETMEVIFTLPKLKVLDLAAQGIITDQILQKIPHRITELSLDNCQGVTESGIISLIRSMPNLSKLSITLCSVSKREVLEEINALTKTWINKKSFVIGWFEDSCYLYFDGITVKMIFLLDECITSPSIEAPNS